mmetsp:Transcript_20896/g.57091  ORF Transcript_20896/g.57091 Transcript_20896/m.57091 type:complete len:200 (-) Transcript_20896:59-658(-)
MHGTARLICAVARCQSFFTLSLTSEAKQYFTAALSQGLPAPTHCARSERPCNKRSCSCDAAFMSPSTQSVSLPPQSVSMGCIPVTLFTPSRVITAPLCTASFTDMSSSALLSTSMASVTLSGWASRSWASAASIEPLLTTSTISIAAPRTSLSSTTSKPSSRTSLSSVGLGISSGWASAASRLSASACAIDNLCSLDWA